MMGTRNDAADEHAGTAFPCSFRVGFALVDNPDRRHTQNEHLVGTDRLCQGLDRGPEPRCADRGGRGGTVHHRPHRNRRRRLSRGTSRTRHHPRFHPSRGDAGRFQLKCYRPVLSKGTVSSPTLWELAGSQISEGRGRVPGTPRHYPDPGVLREGRRSSVGCWLAGNPVVTGG